MASSCGDEDRGGVTPKGEAVGGGGGTRFGPDSRTSSSGFRGSQVFFRPGARRTDRFDLGRGLWPVLPRHGYGGRMARLQVGVQTGCIAPLRIERFGMRMAKLAGADS